MQSLNTLAALLFLALTSVSGEVVSSDATQVGHEKGKIRFFYDDEYVQDSCSVVVILGVGTAMTVNDYQDLAFEITSGTNAVTVFADHNPDWFVKTDPEAYASLANELVSDLAAVIPLCESKTPLIAIGGHSSSGMAAVKALPLLHFVPDGFVGLDPFDFEETPSIPMPSLLWGFAETTCAVSVEKAAKIAFEGANRNSRVFFQIQNLHEELTHCSFSDKGCEIVCPEREGSDLVRRAVGVSLQIFTAALVHGHSLDRKLFETVLVDTALEAKLFVNHDEVLVPLQIASE